MGSYNPTDTSTMYNSYKRSENIEEGSIQSPKGDLNDDNNSERVSVDAKFARGPAHG